MAEDLPLLVLNDLRLPSRTPLHVDVPVTLVVSGGYLEVDIVVQVRLEALKAHHHSWVESPA